jgi:DNA-binding GntR family transcriptional regulator
MRKLAAESARGLAHVAYRRVRDGILSGRLVPGTPLSRRRLAEDLGMSSVPVGEALTRLEAEGVVESRPRAGTRVKIPEPREIHGQYVVREALETHGARLFAELAGARDRRRLVSAAQKLDRASTTPESMRGTQARARVARIHFDFHMFITAATGCKELLVAIERSRVLLSNWLFSVSMDSPALPGRWHEDLAEVLAGGSPEEAAEAMRIHVRYRQEEVIKAFRRMNEEAFASNGRVVRGPQRRTLERLKRA